MPLFIKQSFIYKAFEKIIIKPYKNSLLKNFIQKLLMCFKNSFIFKRTEKYLNKQPYFLNSGLYKLFRIFLSKLDLFMNFLNRIFTNMFGGSSFCNGIYSIKKDTKSKKLLLLSLLIGFFNFFYILIGAILNTTNLKISSSLLALTFILYLFSQSENCFKESFIYKIFKSW